MSPYTAISDSTYRRWLRQERPSAEEFINTAPYDLRVRIQIVVMDDKAVNSTPAAQSQVVF